MDERRLIEGRRIRWDEARAQAAYAAGLWVRQTLGDALKSAAEQEPGRALIVDGSVRLDGATLYRQATALARALLTRAAPGSVVSFMLPNWHEAATIYLATHLAGMVANPILPSLRDRDLTFILQDLQSRFVFIPAQFRGHDYAEMLSRVAPQLSPPPEVVVVRGQPGAHLPYASLFAAEASELRELRELPELPSVDPDAVRLVLYTSGTTGTPKGVLHSQNSIHALVRQLGRFWHIAPGDTFLVPSPISHIGGSIYAFECPLLLGTTAVLAEKWDADSALDLMAKERCTHMAGATPFLQQLLDAATRAGTRLNGLKVFICGGASVPPSLIRKAAAHFDKTIFTRVYGSTEVPVTTVGVPDRGDLAHAAETDGRVGFGEVKLVGASGERSNQGEIRARGPQMLIGYLHPEDEAAVFDAEGYYRTGDLGCWLDQDYLVVSGRTKDIIIRKGENIAAKEIEDILYEHPAIADIAVIGLPDDLLGERCCAVVVLRDGATLGLTDIVSYCRDAGLAMQKIPEQLEIVAELPRNASGKVLKFKLQEEFATS
jgi:acyl-CoA synthetase (AMP-forming)/AMP-acid ligase II